MTHNNEAATVAVLRNVNSTTDDRYLSRDFRGYLVEVSEAKRFRTAAAAERFLSRNVEFIGYRVEMVRK
jgi:hypothetical protein